MMTEHWWAPYLFIAIAGWLATDLWRWLGVLAGNRLKEDSEALHWVRAVATALVMAVTAKLIVFPTGTLEASPMAAHRRCHTRFHRISAGGPTGHRRCGCSDPASGGWIVRTRFLMLALSEY